MSMTKERLEELEARLLKGECLYPSETKDLIAAARKGLDAQTELLALRKDKERLDWLDGYKTGNYESPYWKICDRTPPNTTLRQAIDSAIAATEEEFPYVCPKCKARFKDPEALGNPFSCPHDGTTLQTIASEGKVGK